jgi:hypothetical protein
MDVFRIVFCDQKSEWWLTRLGVVEGETRAQCWECASARFDGRPLKEDTDLVLFPVGSTVRVSENGRESAFVA